MPKILHAWRKNSRERQPAETISDYGAAQIAVASPEAKDAVVAAVNQNFPVLREQDVSPSAIRSTVTVATRSRCRCRMDDRRSCSRPPGVLEANRQEHHEYKTARNAEFAGRTADQAKAGARAINDSAMKRFNSRNGLRTQWSGVRW